MGSGFSGGIDRSEGSSNSDGGGDRPPCWPYLGLLAVWVAATLWMAIVEWGEAPRPTVGAAGRGAWGAAQALILASRSAALFFLLGFVAKSVAYIRMGPPPAPGDPAPPGAAGPPTAVLYLTAGDFDAVAVDSLLRLRSPGPKLFILHDDRGDAEARARMQEFLERHPRRAEWEIAVWSRPRRSGGKAGAVNWVLEHLDRRWELLLLCDCDSIALREDALLHAVPEFDAPDVAIVQFRNAGFSGPSDSPLQRRLARAVDVFDVFAAPAARWGYLPFFGHNALLRVEHVRQVGGLAPGFFSDDLDLSVRLSLAGRRIIYRRDIPFGERHPADFAAFRRRARKWALGCMQVCRLRARQVLTAPGLPLAHRIGMLEFMSFYPAQALFVLGLLLVHLIGPWLHDRPSVPPSGCAAVGTAVLLAIVAPTLAWSWQARALGQWPALAWTCVLVYGGSLVSTVRGVLDGLSSCPRDWIPTNLSQGRATVPPAGWAELAVGLALVGVPWWFASPELLFPSTYLFIGVFLFSPLTFATYRQGLPGQRDTPRAGPARRARSGLLAAAGLALVCLALLIPGGGTVSGVRVDGKRLLVDGRPFTVRGIHYSPWRPGGGPADPGSFPLLQTVEGDLARIASLGANVVLIHDAPGWVIDAARRHGLRTIYAFSINWNDPSEEGFQSQAGTILERITELRAHSGLLAWILGHEIPVWALEHPGAATISARLRDLAERVRQVDPGRPIGHANWPPTRELDLSFMDLACFNVYPAWPYEVSVRGFGPYLREVLAPLAAGKPLLVTEFGINSLEAGESRQAQVLADCWREIAAGPAIGGIVFEWCDQWWKNYDNPIPGKGYWQRAWAPDDAARHDDDPEEHYGLVRADGSAKPALAAVRDIWRAHHHPRAIWPWLVLAGLALLTAAVLRCGMPMGGRRSQSRSSLGGHPHGEVQP